ncbi:MAG TPA: sulfatase-like hydrolase/transferase, partial [Armatimonadaceae bacterium]|nr:sulfatase-like hydrolase/transferase [Armatimonadaceae bacterium]
MNDTRPNILLITSDQHHWSALGVHNPLLRTPNLDRLCREGTRFDRAYCNNPVCSPSRSTIITGMYPSWHGCWTIGVKLAEDVPTVGERFQEAGYATTLIGKAHFQPLRSEPGQESLEVQPKMRDLEFWRGFTGPWYGFEHVEVARNHGDESHAGQHYGIWLEEKGLTDWPRYFRTFDPQTGQQNERSHEGAWELPEEYHYSVWTAERSIAAIDRAHDEEKPFFLWASFHDPHPPYLVPEPWASLYDPDEMTVGYPLDPPLAPGEFERMPPQFAETQKVRPDFSQWRETPYGNHGFSSHLVPDEKMRRNIALYYGMVSLMDREIGRILDRLDELGIADNTVVVFTTDHGHFLGQHGLTAKGAFHYEDLLRLPFIVRWPGRVPAGRVSESLQALIDLPSTFLSAAGEPVPGVMQGVDQVPVWTGEAESARDHVITEFRHQPTKVHLRTYI